MPKYKNEKCGDKYEIELKIDVETELKTRNMFLI
jgi:hypothetical protein